jgi:hypothetical protein
VQELQNQLKQDRDRGAGHDGDGHGEEEAAATPYYSRIDFMADSNTLDVTLKSLESLSIAAESSGSEVRELMHFICAKLLLLLLLKVHTTVY